MKKLRMALSTIELGLSVCHNARHSCFFVSRTGKQQTAVPHRPGLSYITSGLSGQRFLSRWHDNTLALRSANHDEPVRHVVRVNAPFDFGVGVVEQVVAADVFGARVGGQKAVAALEAFFDAEAPHFVIVRAVLPESAHRAELRKRAQ